MKYWDSSAIIPLLVQETTSANALALLEADRDMATWWATPVECYSALARKNREGTLTSTDLDAVYQRLETLQASWIQAEPSDEIRRMALRLLRLHDLRAADSLQLAAAIILSDHKPSTLPIVCSDQRLRKAAEREGFPIIEPAMK